MSLRPFTWFAPASAILLLGTGSVFGEAIYEPFFVSVFAGSPMYQARDGVGTAARFDTFKSLRVGNDANLYAVDNSGVRRITPDATVTTVVRGDFSDVAVNTRGEIYVAQTGSQAIGQVTAQGDIESTMLPNGSQIAFDAQDDLYILKTNEVVRVSSSGEATTLSVAVQGAYLALGANRTVYTSGSPSAVDSKTNSYAAGFYALIMYSPAGSQELSNWSGPLWPICDPSVMPIHPIPPPQPIAVDNAGTIFLAAEGGVILKGTINGPVSVFAGMKGGPGSADGIGDAARFGGIICFKPGPLLSGRSTSRWIMRAIYTSRIQLMGAFAELRKNERLRHSHLAC